VLAVQEATSPEEPNQALNAIGGRPELDLERHAAAAL
jgi:hypothetical protein